MLLLLRIDSFLWKGVRLSIERVDILTNENCDILRSRSEGKNSLRAHLCKRS